MTIELLVLGSVPAIAANLWHQLLISTRAKPYQTISQHATETEKKLLAHRVVHSVSSFSLILFAWLYLFRYGYTWAGSILVAGAVFDILEVLTLTKRSAEPVFAINYHAITAWTMALGYILYVIAIVSITGMPEGLSWGILIVFVLLLRIAFRQKFKNFWIIQHVYFCLLAILIVLAHVQLFLIK